MPAQFDAYFTVMDASILSLMGEDCTFYPKAGGGSRTITGVVDQTGEFREGSRSLDSDAMLHVLVSRDDDGIATPELGDAIAREGSDELFAFTGRKQEVSSTYW